MPGLGVIRGLEAVLDPRDLTCVVIGHMHADHYLDLAGLRYLFPWAGEPPRSPPRPPAAGRSTAAGRPRRARSPSARASSTTPSTSTSTTRTSSSPSARCRMRFMRGQHYVPAWGVSIVAPDGARLVYTGDTGPTDDDDRVRPRLRPAARRGRRSGTPADDDPRRGHLTPEEAIELAHGRRCRARPCSSTIRRLAATSSKPCAARRDDRSVPRSRV